MHLQPIKVEPHLRDLRVRCCVCHSNPTIQNAYADLDGVPFISYYCTPCMQMAVDAAAQFPADIQAFACDYDTTGSRRPGTRSHTNAD